MTPFERFLVGRRAIEIRNLNAKRIMAKNDVSKHFNEFNEYKYNHASKVDPDVE
jgi:hypothetical protein